MVRLKACAVLIGYAAYATDDCSGVRRSPVLCYECTTMSAGEICADPFNESEAQIHPKVKVEECKFGGFCTKWVLRPKQGPVEYIRGCSSNLPLNIQLALVCMSESRPGNGELCFCHRDRCNSAPGMRAGTKAYFFTLLVSLMTLLFIHNLRFHTFCFRHEHLYANETFDVSKVTTGIGLYKLREVHGSLNNSTSRTKTLQTALRCIHIALVPYRHYKDTKQHTLGMEIVHMLQENISANRHHALSSLCKESNNVSFVTFSEIDGFSRKDITLVFPKTVFFAMEHSDSFAFEAIWQIYDRMNGEHIELSEY